MPLYICFCPDYPNGLEKRLAARSDHLAAAKPDREAGKSDADPLYPVFFDTLRYAVFGRAYLTEAHSSAAPGGMDGSTMIWRYPTLDQAWERIKRDPYWLQGVWDKEKLVVRELAEMDGDDSLRVVTA